MKFESFLCMGTFRRICYSNDKYRPLKSFVSFKGRGITGKSVAYTFIFGTPSLATTYSMISDRKEARRLRRFPLILFVVSAMVLLFATYLLFTFGQGNVICHLKPPSIADEKSYEVISSGEEFIRWNEEVYSDVVRQRREALNERYNGDLSNIIPWDGMKATYLWDFFPPAWNCPWRERLGRFSEGGKVVCNLQAFKQLDSPVVYSYGIRDDTSFEEDLISKTGCVIYAFDPSIAKLPQENQNIIFRKIGLGDTTAGDFETLESTMRSNGHSRIDLLKIDCEGCEWSAFNDKSVRNILNQVDQLLIELHFGQKNSNNYGEDSLVKEVFDFFEMMEESGLRPFSWEVNHNPSGYFDQKPWAIEYSFVRRDSTYMMLKAPVMPPETAMKFNTFNPAIVYLTSSSINDIKHLHASLSKLGKALPQSSAPILIFHEYDFPEDAIVQLTASLSNGRYKGKIYFHLIEFSLPEGCCNFPPSWKKRTQFGYHNMIRFWIKDLWTHDAIKIGGYTHVMRLDTDSYINAMQPDALPFMHEKIVYRGNMMQYDSSPEVVQMFYEFAKNLSTSSKPRNQNIIDHILSSWENERKIPIIYNNFFVAKVEFFQRDEVQKILNKACCESPNYFVYRYRWGDAILHYFILGMAAASDEIILNNPPHEYQHGGLE